MKKSSLFLLFFIALLPILLLRDYTPSNELRYLNIVDEALQNGSVFTFTNQGEFYADKPPLHFWLMMAGKKILGGHKMWYYALLSFIPALVIVATMCNWIRRERNFDETTTALMLMTTGLFLGTAIIVRMDMLMNMFIVLALYTFYRMYKGKDLKRNSWLFPVFVFLALFSKGPLGLLIPFVSTLVFLIYKRKLSYFSRYWGWRSLVILLSGCIVWFTGAYLEGGNEYIHNLLFRQTVGRGINAFHHKEPFYYYAITSWYAIAPWSIFSIGIFVVSLFKKKIKSDLEQFFAVIVISSFVLLSLISSKLAIYSLPIFPFLIALALLLLPKYRYSNRWILLSLAIPAIILVLSLPGIFVMNLKEELPFLKLPLVMISAGILSLTGIITIYLLYYKNSIVNSIRLMSLGLLLSIFIAGWSMKELNPYLGWGNLCAKAKEIAKEQQVNTYWVYNISRAENMSVYLDRKVTKVEKEDIVKSSDERKILLLKSKDIHKDLEIFNAVQHKEQYSIGGYIIVLFK